MLTLMFCIASGFASFVVYKAAAEFPRRVQSVTVSFSKSDHVSTSNKQRLIPMTIVCSQVEQCIDTYCELGRNPIFIDAIVETGCNLMEVQVDGVMVVQMRVEKTCKEIVDYNKHGGNHK
jgi:hypothetical protein